MPQTTTQKLRIKEGMSLLTLHAPEDFQEKLQTLPNALTLSATAKKYDQIHWFVTSKTQLEKEVEKVVKMIKSDVVCWIYYPKISSKIKTDITRDKGWDALEKHAELQFLSLISFDETWSAFGMRLKAETNENEVVTTKPREIFNYVDPVNKTVRLPDDLTQAFDENKNAGDLFNKLSFTNKKEYIEWVITAKREETRLQRVKGTIERLEKGWKNPANI